MAKNTNNAAHADIAVALQECGQSFANGARAKFDAVVKYGKHCVEHKDKAMSAADAVACYQKGRGTLLTEASLKTVTSEFATFAHPDVVARMPEIEMACGLYLKRAVGSAIDMYRVAYRVATQVKSGKAPKKIGSDYVQSRAEPQSSKAAKTPGKTVTVSAIDALKEIAASVRDAADTSKEVKAAIAAMLKKLG